MSGESASPAPVGGLLRDAFSEFQADRALRLGAGLAYYGLVTLAPLLILLIGITGLVLGEEAADGELASKLGDRLGTDLAQLLEDAVQALDVVGTFANVTVVSLAVLLFTASVLFVAWKDALNVIWDVEYRGGVKRTLLRRLFGIAVIGGLAALLIALFVAESVLAMLGNLLSDEPLIDTAFRIATSLVPVALSALLLATLYRFGPDVEVSWRAVWTGTILAVVLLALLAWGYGLYVDATSSSVAGVASSILLLVVLVYFAAQVLLFCAEVIKIAERAQQRRARLDP